MALSPKEAIKQLGAPIGAAVLLVLLAHSRFLFSWDSANYAFALDRIDIAQHRPHPPGYLGYVFLVRLFRAVLRDTNRSFIAWNLFAMTAGLIGTAYLTAPESRNRAGVLGGTVLLFSPLMLLYASVAEIYVSELACVVAVALSVDAMLRGRPGASYWCALTLVLTALIKLPTAVLILPAVVYAFVRARQSVREAMAAMGIFVVGVAGVCLLFSIAQPGFLASMWNQFLASTAQTRVFSDNTAHVGLSRVLNRNVRDTLVAGLEALGANAIAFAVWVAVDRTGPSGPRGWFDTIWIATWLVELLVIHIAKPGYILPLLPVAAVVLGRWYAALPGRMGVMLASMAAVVNVTLFLIIRLPAPNDSRKYADKTRLEQIESDLKPLTFPTNATLRQSDDAVLAFMNAAAQCSTGAWVVVAGSSHVDWRRAMFYLPTATAINIGDRGEFLFVGRNGDSTSVSGPTPVSSACGLLWLSDGRPAVQSTSGAERIQNVGWRFPAGDGVVAPTSLVWRTTERAVSKKPF